MQEGVRAGLSVIKSRLAAELHCSVDLFMKGAEEQGNGPAHEERPGLACLEGA
jgi:hypothetical protein